jgi:hypothetical protein
VPDDEGRVPDNCAEELLFGNLLEVGESKFGEEFLLFVKNWSVITAVGETGS